MRLACLERPERPRVPGRGTALPSCFLIGILLVPLRASNPEALVSGIRAFHHSGQTFLLWEEKEVPEWTTFAVYRSDAPIRDLAPPAVTCLARDIIPRSGRDFFFLKRAGYVRDNPKLATAYQAFLKKSQSLQIPGLPLPAEQGSANPMGGLFVHTAAKPGRSYYAVTWTPYGKDEVVALAPGANVLDQPVTESVNPPQPYLIYDSGGNLPAEKKPGTLYLYAISGTADVEFARTLGQVAKTYLFWMPQEFGWREGLPTMVTVRYKPSDDLYELWPDDSNFAFMGFDNSWWYGHNTEILRPERLPQGVVKDYAHRKLLFLIEWMFKTFPGVDRERFGCDGSSMGGTGALCFAIRHPDIFSSVNPHVPAADVARLPNAKHSFEVLFGPLGSDIRTGTGTLVWDELNNVRYIEQTRRNLPFVRLRHGRYDTWMLWEHTVRLYQALEKNRHGYIAWWAPAGHSVGVYTIPLFDKHPSNQWRIHESFIAVSDCSNNEKPGNGDPGDGDGYGGANLYLEWNVLADTADTYQARIRSLRGPVTVTITPRRCQRFLPQPGETLTYQVAGTLNRAGEVTVDADGLFSLEKLGPVPAGAWVTVTWKPK